MTAKGVAGEARHLLAKDQRLANLDLLRCIAIWMVIVNHVSAMWPPGAGSLPDAVVRITRTGRLGVDLFFVLSGWLIGGLFWRENRAFGSVGVGRFVLRRLIRTVPPYTVALLAAWIGVRHSNTPTRDFDFGYCVFIQNYYRQRPYFLNSWSLCVEEHFYLLLPLLLTFALRWRRPLPYFFLVAALTPLAIRCAIPSEHARHPLASHLWFEGLLLGVWASYTRYTAPEIWPRVERLARWMLTPSILYLMFSEQLSESFRYYFGITLAALSCTFVLVSVAERLPLPSASSRFVYYSAIWSYSLYLTHGMAVNAVKVVSIHWRWPEFVYPALSVLVILITGVGFHYLFEATSIAVRNRLIPSRAPLRNPSAEADPGI